MKYGVYVARYGRTVLLTTRESREQALHTAHALTHFGQLMIRRII